MESDEQLLNFLQRKGQASSSQTSMEPEQKKLSKICINVSFQFVTYLYLNKINHKIWKIEDVGPYLPDMHALFAYQLYCRPRSASPCSYD